FHMTSPPPPAQSGNASAASSGVAFAARTDAKVRDRLPEAGSTTAKTLMMLARIGYASRGAVYLLVGGLALAAALPLWNAGTGNQAQGSRGAIASLTDEPWGQTMIVIIGIGLFGYALWRFLQGVMDTDAHGTDGKGLAVRAGLIVSAVSHTLLGIYALSLVFGWTFGLGNGGGGGGAGTGTGTGAGTGSAGAANGGGGGSTSLTAEIMAMPFGRWLVGLIGVAIIAAGIAQLVKAYKGGFRKWLDLSADKMRKVSPICRFGLAAKGFSFGLIGFFLIVAAWNANPSQSRGLGGALQSLRDQPYGVWLLGITALGLLAFAVYSFIEAWARRIAVRKAVPGQ
ncbi:MAG: DUF1206 domain-containing protein, partial [Planctomycetota bacterium]